MEHKNLKKYFVIADKIYRKHFSSILNNKLDTDYSRPECLFLIIEMLQMEDAKNF